MKPGPVGAPMKRLEDPALLEGRGRFVDDIHLPDTLHAAFVRSPHAHAAIRGIDTSPARAVDGVHAVLTMDDIAGRLTSRHLLPEATSATDGRNISPPLLAWNEVCHVGEAVAVVIAESRYRAEDAATRVAIDYEPLAAAADCRAALAPGAPTAHANDETNVAGRFTTSYGDCDAAFARADHVFRQSLWQHKGCGHALECRGIVAHHDELQDLLTVWASTQVPHKVHASLVKLLGCAEDRVRVIAPDVGGGFGPKFVSYPEESVVALAAQMLRRPVKWIEDRREHFTATVQERDQYWDLEVAVDADARLLGVRGSMIHDQGAYTLVGFALPGNAATNVPGPYILPNYQLEVTVAYTNKITSSAVRGAGYPQATFAMERLMDRVARELGMDRAEVRRRNLIPAERMPYTVPLKTRDGAAVIYDSGDYPACLARALATADQDGFAARQAAARRSGRHLGLGIACYVKGTGRGPFESARVRIGPSGAITVYTGAAEQGQGIKMALAQICAEQFDAAVGDIAVVAGDSGALSLGLGTYASRQAVTAGSSVHLAAGEVRDKALTVASHLLEASRQDLEIADQRVRVKGVPELSISLGDIADALSGKPGYALPGGMEPGLEADAHFNPTGLAFCNGVHVVEVAVDVETGAVRIERYVVVHDSGRLINPMIVDGQIVGGVAHGIGNALYEWMGYDGDAQPVTTTFADYLLPGSAEVPTIEIITEQTPSPVNPLGVKGVGESGTTPASAAIISAVEDALTPFDIRICETPITPARIVELIADAPSIPRQRKTS